MNIPGFTAEASLTRPMKDYRPTGYISQINMYGVVPQQIRPPRCFLSGSYLCCWYPFAGWQCTRVHGLPE
jgi:hypothetical protein